MSRPRTPAGATVIDLSGEDETKVQYVNRVHGRENEQCPICLEDLHDVGPWADVRTCVEVDSPLVQYHCECIVKSLETANADPISRRQFTQSQLNDVRDMLQTIRVQRGESGVTDIPELSAETRRRSDPHSQNSDGWREVHVDISQSMEGMLQSLYDMAQGESMARRLRRELELDVGPHVHAMMGILDASDNMQHNDLFSAAIDASRSLDQFFEWQSGGAPPAASMQFDTDL